MTRELVGTPRSPKLPEKFEYLKPAERIEYGIVYGDQRHIVASWWGDLDTARDKAEKDRAHGFVWRSVITTTPTWVD